jgi:hypothetical protein
MLPPSVRQPVPPPLVPWCSPRSEGQKDAFSCLPRPDGWGWCGFYELQKIEPFIYFGKVYIPCVEIL